MYIVFKFFSVNLSESIFNKQSTLISFKTRVTLPINIAFSSDFLYNNKSVDSIFLFSNNVACKNISTLRFSNPKFL